MYSKSIFKQKNYWIGVGVGIATVLIYQKFFKKEKTSSADGDRYGDNQYGQIPNLSAAKVAAYESVTLNQPTHVNRLGTNDYEIVNSSTPDSGVLKVVARNHVT